jgi:hypothetical protein
MMTISKAQRLCIAILTVSLVAMPACILAYIRQYPTEEAVIQVAEPILKQGGYTLTMEALHGEPLRPEPWVLGVNRLCRGRQHYSSRLGRGTPSLFSNKRRFVAPGDASLQVEIDVSAGLAYHLTITGDEVATNLFPDISERCAVVGIPVRFNVENARQ